MYEKKNDYEHIKIMSSAEPLSFAANATSALCEYPEEQLLLLRRGDLLESNLISNGASARLPRCDKVSRASQ